MEALNAWLASVLGASNCWFLVPQAIEYRPLFVGFTEYLPIDWVCFPIFWVVTSLMFTHPNGVLLVPSWSSTYVLLPWVRCLLIRNVRLAYFVPLLAVLSYTDALIPELLAFTWAIWFTVCVDGFTCLGAGVDWVDKAWTFDGAVK